MELQTTLYTKRTLPFYVVRRNLIAFVFASLCFIYALSYSLSYESTITSSESTRITLVSSRTLRYYPFNKSDNNLFFIESSCYDHSTAAGALHLNPRQACSIYSAAVHNPKKTVTLVHSCPLFSNYYDNSSTTNQILLNLPNVKVIELDLKRFYLNSVLAPLILNGKLRSSVYPVEHNADILRALLIHEFGGTYLDLDIVILKSLDELGEDYIVSQDRWQLANGAFHFRTKGNGHEYLGLVLAALVDNFSGTTWAGNGPTLAKDILAKFCNIPKGTDWTRLDLIPSCNITVHPPSVFYPLDFRNWKLYYRGTYKEISPLLNHTYGVHVWNHMSPSSEKITVGSDQPYGVLAENHCRPIYDSSGKYF